MSNFHIRKNRDKVHLTGKRLGLKDRIFPKEGNFYKMLSDQVSKTLEGIEALGKFVRNQSLESGNRVKEIEREADELRRILVEELHQTFVTPMDREDIYALSRAIDDIMDYANSTVDEMKIYEVSPEEHLQEMVDILGKAAREISDAVRILETYPHIAMQHAVKAKSYENAMEKAYHTALADLFKKTDTVYMLKMREIYRHLSNAADRSDEAADIICSVVMKAT
jgi:predicted phosphate transport protein (TIGR00153 family)